MKNLYIWFHNHILWYLKQLLPLMYVSEYTEAAPCSGCGDVRRLTIWRMWFGRCFAVRSWELAGRVSGGDG